MLFGERRGSDELGTCVTEGTGLDGIDSTTEVFVQLRRACGELCEVMVMVRRCLRWS